MRMNQRKYREITKRVLTVMFFAVLVFSLPFSLRVMGDKGQKNGENPVAKLPRRAAEEVVPVTPSMQVDENGVAWYLISDAAELYWFAQEVNGYDTQNTKGYVPLNAKLTDDITVQSLNIQNGELTGDLSELISWTPIGDSTHKYAGQFDGQGHSISGLYLNVETTTSASNHGFFSEIGVGTWNSNTYRGRIFNLDIENSYFASTATNLGSIAGVNRGGRIYNCGFSGVIKGSGSVAGGLLGTNANQSTIQGEVENCWCDVQLESVMGAGGLVGQNNGIVTHCRVEGSVRGASATSVHSYSGGLVGTCGGNRNATYGLVINCYSRAQVSSSESGAYIGALAGKATGGYFINCYGSGYEKKGFGEVPTTGISEATGKEINNYYYEVTEGDQTTGAYYPVAYNCYYMGERDTIDTSTFEYSQIPGATPTVFASGKVAYWLNHGSKAEVYQAFGLTVPVAYGQQLGDEDAPVFLNEEKSNEVYQITYEGDYEDEVYCNSSTVLPVCGESGYTYEFFYADTEKAGEMFDGNQITEDAHVTVNRISVIPGEDAQGVFQIKNAMHLKWFSDYVNGQVEYGASTADPTKASAVLLADIDMTGENWTPIGGMNTGTTEEGERYKEAYKGSFDGQYHVITGLQASGTSYMGLFGCTYGARICRLGLENVALSGKDRVGGICGVALGTKMINCYVTGTVIGRGSFSGGIAGYADVITVGTAADYASATLGTEIYRCYASCDRAVDSSGSVNVFAGGICGGVAAARQVNGEQEKVSLADCYYDEEQTAGVQVAYYMQTGTNQYEGREDAGNSVVGLDTKAFSGGKVAWLLQQASAQQGDRGIAASDYKATDSLTGSDGIQDVTLRSQDLIWCQKLPTEGTAGKSQLTPHFAEGKSDGEKQQLQVYRYAAINVNQVYEKDGLLVEKYGNAGYTVTLPQGYPVYPQNASDAQEPHYFVGWTKTPASEVGKTLITEGFVVQEDSYLYAWYDAEGRIDIQCEEQEYSLEYGRVYQGEAFSIKATGSMSEETNSLLYQWYIVEQGQERELSGETGNSYAVPVDLSVGSYSLFCRVTAPSGKTKDSPAFSLTITKKPLAKELFGEIPAQYYTGEAVAPGVCAADSEIRLMKESDYEVRYENNQNLTTEQSMAQAVVTASNGGNYSGSVTLPFSITYLPASEDMYVLLGEEADGYFLDSVQIVPKGGYLMGSRLNGTYSEEGITFQAIQEFDTYTLHFYIQDARTKAMTDVITRQVKVKKTAQQEEAGEGEHTGNSTEENTRQEPTSAPSGGAPLLPVEVPGSEVDYQTPQVNSYGEVISYFDGWEKPKTGQYYTIGNYRYKVTKSTVAGGFVELNRVVNPRLKTANIPVYVTINGFHYLVDRVGNQAFYKHKKIKSIAGGDNVKTIGKYAFAACPKLEKVTLGKKVVSLGKYAFYKDGKLATLTVKSSKLKKVGKNALKKTADGIMIKVPSKCRKSYRKVFAKKGQKRGKIK